MTVNETHVFGTAANEARFGFNSIDIVRPEREAEPDRLTASTTA